MAALHRVGRGARGRCQHIIGQRADVVRDALRQQSGGAVVQRVVDRVRLAVEQKVNAFPGAAFPAAGVANHGGDIGIRQRSGPLGRFVQPALRGAFCRSVVQQKHGGRSGPQRPRPRTSRPGPRPATGPPRRRRVTDDDGMRVPPGHGRADHDLARARKEHKPAGASGAVHLQHGLRPNRQQGDRLRIDPAVLPPIGPRPDQIPGPGRSALAVDPAPAIPLRGQVPAAKARNLLPEIPLRPASPKDVLRLGAGRRWTGWKTARDSDRFRTGREARSLQRSTPSAERCRGRSTRPAGWHPTSPRFRRPSALTRRT